MALWADADGCTEAQIATRAGDREARVRWWLIAKRIAQLRETAAKDEPTSK